MVIDDDRNMRQFMRLILEKAGHEVIEAKNGEEGIKACDREQVDLIFLDIFMPVKDGIETVLELRERHPGCTVVTISGGGGSGNFDYLKYSERFGASSSLTKPFSKHELLECVARYAR
ncbi:MAG: response regulator [Desulfovibrionaceae bacterium]